MEEYILLIIGGLLLFLYGILLISNSLTRISGKRIKKIINLATKSDLSAVIIGILITCVFHSSSAISVILITFISAKLISLRSALFILMGSNIGTTATAFIISLDITKYYMLFIIIGCFILLINKLQKIKDYGHLFFGLGIFFMGLTFMSNSVSYLIASRQNLFFKVTNNNILNNLLISTLFTGIIQSSSAMIKITQELYNLELINLSSALVFVLGANIGTTITGIIASIKATKEAKKVALFNVFFNFITTLFVLIFFNRYIFITDLFKNYFNLSFDDTVTFFHFFFNFTGLSLFALFIPKEKSYNKDNSLI